MAALATAWVNDEDAARACETGDGACRVFRKMLESAVRLMTGRRCWSRREHVILARNRGHIVNVASMAGKMSVPGAAVYTATKFGVVSLSRAVRAEIAKSKVTITTILPAAVRTELTAGLDIKGVPAASPEDVAREILASCRHGRPEVTLPKGLGLIGALEQGLPERFGDFVKRAVGGAEPYRAGQREGQVLSGQDVALSFRLWSVRLAHIASGSSGATVRAETGRWHRRRIRSGLRVNQTRITKADAAAFVIRGKASGRLAQACHFCRIRFNFACFRFPSS